MHIASRKHTSHFEGSKKELSLKTTKLSGNKNIKQTLSESGPENVLATKGYTRTRTFTVGQAKRAVLAFSEEKQRVDGFVVNKDQQLVPIKAHDLPKELRQILNSDAFEAFLKDIHACLTQLSNGDFRLDINQGLKGGVYSNEGNIEYIEERLENLSNTRDLWSGSYEAKIIINNKCDYPIKRIHHGAHTGFFWANYPDEAFRGTYQFENTNENETVNRVIAPNAAGGIFFRSNGLELFKFFPIKGATGYVSVKVMTPGRNYTVVCMFSSSYSDQNAARIMITPSDGNTDELGRINGHGVDATGRFADMQNMFSQSDRADKMNTYKSFETAVTNMFKVKCKFENTDKAYFKFTFKNL